MSASECLVPRGLRREHGITTPVRGTTTSIHVVFSACKKGIVEIMSQPSVPLEPEAIKLVNAALEELKKRHVTNDFCPRCNTSNWNVEPIAITVIPLQRLPAALPMAYSPAHMLALQMVCSNCGYTMFHNLNVLGLTPRQR
jgi:hypothetical protein